MVEHGAADLGGGEGVVGQRRDARGRRLAGVEELEEEADLLAAAEAHAKVQVRTAGADQSGVQELDVVGGHDEDASVVGPDAVQVVEEAAEGDADAAVATSVTVTVSRIVAAAGLLVGLADDLRRLHAPRGVPGIPGGAGIPGVRDGAHAVDVLEDDHAPVGHLGEGLVEGRVVLQRREVDGVDVVRRHAGDGEHHAGLAGARGTVEQVAALVRQPHLGVPFLAVQERPHVRHEVVLCRGVQHDRTEALGAVRRHPGPRCDTAADPFQRPGSQPEELLAPLDRPFVHVVRLPHDGHQPQEHLHAVPVRTVQGEDDPLVDLLTAPARFGIRHLVLSHVRQPPTLERKLDRLLFLRQHRHDTDRLGVALLIRPHDDGSPLHDRRMHRKVPDERGVVGVEVRVGHEGHRQLAVGEGVPRCQPSRQQPPKRAAPLLGVLHEEGQRREQRRGQHRVHQRVAGPQPALQVAEDRVLHKLLEKV